MSLSDGFCMASDNSLLLHILADYGHVDDMAFAEVKQAVRAVTQGLDIDYDMSSVPAFDTIATGFYLAQLALNSPFGNRHLFYVNTAPRKDDVKPRENCAGEGLAYAELHNGVRIVAVNSGYSLSFVKTHAKTIRILDVHTAGSQFRSRDNFPAAVGDVAHGRLDRVGADIMDAIPDMPADVIAYTDGYGNIKTSIHHDELDNLTGKKVNVTINGVTKPATIGVGIFAVPEGEFILSAGSSGWVMPDGTKRRFVECVFRGFSASKAFNHPKGGDTITWDVI